MERPIRSSGVSAPHGHAGNGSKRQSQNAVQKAKKRGKVRRDTHRREHQVAEDAQSHTVRASIAQRRLRAAAPIQMAFTLAGQKVSAPAYVGLPDAKVVRGEEREYSLEEMVGAGSTFDFGYFAWDGMYVYSPLLAGPPLTPLQNPSPYQRR